MLGPFKGYLNVLVCGKVINKKNIRNLWFSLVELGIDISILQCCGKAYLVV